MSSDWIASTIQRLVPTHRITIYSGTLIFLLRLGIINAGHSIRFAHDFAPARQWLSKLIIALTYSQNSTSSVTALLLLSLLKKLDKLSDRIEVEAMQWKDIVMEREYIFVYDER